MKTKTHSTKTRRETHDVLALWKEEWGRIITAYFKSPAGRKMKDKIIKAAMRAAEKKSHLQGGAFVLKKYREPPV